MRCPLCSGADSRVLESRLLDQDSALRRRRECSACKARFTTYERVEAIPLVVVKRDGKRQPFDAQKLLRGLLQATVKSPLPTDDIAAMATEIEAALVKRNLREVTSEEIGELVLERLRTIDEVAYVRFASVYRHFSSIEDFLRELSRLAGKKDPISLN
ncbi:MAG: transcriptional regulator NrdR [Cyanobacteria bacterium REEB65]|nr:transcriptional regulator NrdR [Cyanobacteria bacterium REEB65]